jgi:hypothetical protein
MSGERFTIVKNYRVFQTDNPTSKPMDDMTEGASVRLVAMSWVLRAANYANRRANRQRRGNHDHTALIVFGFRNKQGILRRSSGESVRFVSGRKSSRS